METLRSLSGKRTGRQAKWPGQPGRDGNLSGLKYAPVKARSGWKLSSEDDGVALFQLSEWPGEPGRDGNIFLFCRVIYPT